MTKRLEQTIQSLSQDLKPMKPLRIPAVRVLQWVFSAIFCLIAGIALFGVRPDFETAVAQPGFWAQASILIALSLTAAFTAIALSVPGYRFASRGRMVSMALASLWALLLVLLGIGVDWGHAGGGITCIRDTLVLGALPAAVLFVLIRSGANLLPSWTALLTGIAVSALGALGTQFICKNDSPVHVLIWHFLPMVLIAILSRWGLSKLIPKI